MKTCSRCSTNKTLDEFFNDRNTRDGKAPSCKACVYKRRLEPKKARSPEGHKRCNGCKTVRPYAEFWADTANKTDGRYSHCKSCKTASTLKWREENKEYYNASMRAYRAAQDPNERRDIDLKSWFGLPYGWYKQTLTAQGHVCAICKKPNRSAKRCLAVDHHHASGKVRGILCYNCNRLLHAFDNVELFDAIMAYLNAHKGA